MASVVRFAAPNAHAKPRLLLVTPRNETA